MFWFKSFRKFFRKIVIFRNFNHWSEILSVSAGRPLGQGVCPSLVKRKDYSDKQNDFNAKWKDYNVKQNDYNVKRNENNVKRHE